MTERSDRGLPVHGADAGILVGLGDDQGFAVLDHPAGHAFAHLHAQVAEACCSPPAAMA